MSRHCSSLLASAAALLVFAIALPASARGTVSLEFDDGDVINVLRMLALESGTNIVIEHGVRHERATMHLRGVSFERALAAVSDAFGLAVRRDGNILIVGSREGLMRGFASDSSRSGNAPRAVAIALRYANAGAALKQLQGVLPAHAFAADEGRNAVLVTGNTDAVDTARSLLAAIDVPTPQVMFEVKVVDLTVDDEGNVGAEFGGASQSGFQPGSTLWTFSNRTIPIEAQLNFLLSKNQAKLLATPRIATLNNQKATLHIGKQFPVVTSTLTGAGAQQSVAYQNIGVDLTVTPQISADGTIVAHLNPRYSTVDAASVQGFPVFGNREIDTTLRVKADETIVLGGLFSDLSSQTITKVPLLGDIPLFGEVFKNRITSHQRDDIVFLITPHILK